MAENGRIPPIENPKSASSGIPNAAREAAVSLPVLEERIVRNHDCGRRFVECQDEPPSMVPTSALPAFREVAIRLHRRFESPCARLRSGSNSAIVMTAVPFSTVRFHVTVILP